MIYRTTTGHTIQTFRVGDEIEFVTSDEKGQTISTARLPKQAAQVVLSQLRKH